MMASTILLCYGVGKVASIASYMCDAANLLYSKQAGPERSGSAP
jgi:hypothetical protein